LDGKTVALRTNRLAAESHSESTASTWIPQHLLMLDNAPEVVLDPQQAFQMRSKLLSERRHFLEDFLKFHEQSWAQETLQSHADFNPRFFATATRDLQRSFDWFLELRERGV